MVVPLLDGPIFLTENCHAVMVNKWLATAESPSSIQTADSGRTSMPKSLILAVLVELTSGAVGARRMSVGSIAD